MKSHVIGALVAGALLLAGGCATMTGSELGLTDDGRLKACPASPNCVCSDETGGVHGIEPIRIEGDPSAAWRALIDYLEREKSYRIIERRDDYLRAEARTRILRFVDDVEFHLRPADGVIAMRSASRLGYSDLGKNRRRLEAVREALSDKL